MITGTRGVIPGVIPQWVIIISLSRVFTEGQSYFGSYLGLLVYSVPKEIVTATNHHSNRDSNHSYY